MSKAIQKMETIQAIDRAFQILETISRSGNMTLAELHEKVNISKASLSRLVYTLVENGYIEKRPNNEYSLTLKTYEVGINAVQNLDQISLINSTLADLSRETGRVAQFSVEDNNQVLCVQSIGQKASAGKAILSTYSNNEIIDKWEKFDVKPLTEHTITDIHALLQDISEVKQRHYALDREENEYNIFCVGALVMNYTNTPLGAISISGTTLTQEEEQTISQTLTAAVKRLSATLGYVMR